MENNLKEEKLENFDENIIYQPLNHTSLNDLVSSFNLAFSDYQVPVSMTSFSLKKMMQIRSVDLKFSTGAFAKNIKNKTAQNDKIPVSFILCGVRKNFQIIKENENENEKTFKTFKKIAYDSGTGTIPDYRRLGIGKNLLKFTIEKLKNYGFDAFLLEVLENNEKAISLYESQGFEVTRRFLCYNHKKDEVLESLKDFDINRFNKARHYNSEKDNFRRHEDHPGCLSFDIQLKGLNSKKVYKNLDFDDLAYFIPSWQNSYRSILNNFENIYINSLFYKGKIVAYGTINQKNGDMQQIGISKNFRNDHKIKAMDDNSGEKDLIKDKEISQLDLLKIVLFDLARNCESKNLTLLNIEEGVVLNELIKNCGFKNFINQFEMVKILKDF